MTGTTAYSSPLAASRCCPVGLTTRRPGVSKFGIAAAAAAAPFRTSTMKTTNKKTSPNPTASAISHLHRRSQRRRGRGGAALPCSSRTISSSAVSAEDGSAPSPELVRAQRALLWRHGGNQKEQKNNDRGGDNSQVKPLDVYTEALLVACGGDEDSRTGAAADTDAYTDASAAAAATAAAEGWSSAGITSVLDQLAFGRLQAIMEKTEVSKGVEVMGMMRQVVVVGAGLDTRAFRMPWPRGTAIFELAHRDVHQFAAAALKSVGAKPSRGCSHRRVPCDPTLPGGDAADTDGSNHPLKSNADAVSTPVYAYGDMEEAMLRAGFAPDVPSLWVLQDVGAMGSGEGDAGDCDCDVAARRRQTRWLDLVEEVADLMCAGSEVVGHVPTRRVRVGEGGGGGAGGGGDGGRGGERASRVAFGELLAQDMAAAGLLTHSYEASELRLTSGGGGGGGGSEDADAEAGAEGLRAAATEQQHLGQLGVFHGIKQRPSKQEVEYYREQIYIAEFELGDDEGFED